MAEIRRRMLLANGSQVDAVELDLSVTSPPYSTGYLTWSISGLQFEPSGILGFAIPRSTSLNDYEGAVNPSNAYLTIVSFYTTDFTTNMGYPKPGILYIYPNNALSKVYYGIEYIYKTGWDASTGTISLQFGSYVSSTRSILGFYNKTCP